MSELTASGIPVVGSLTAFGLPVVAALTGEGEPVFGLVVATAVGSAVGSSVATGIAPPAPQLVFPIADVAANGWLPSIPAASLASMLADGSTGIPDDTTYAYSPDNPTLPMRVKFGPLNAGSTTIATRVNCLQRDTTFLFTLYCSGTQVAQWSQLVNADQAAQQVNYTLTADDVAAIAAAGGDLTDIELEILAGQ